LRPERFVTRKIVAAACRIADGSNERLHLGNLDIERDWGWAPDYVEAMWLMLRQNEPQDFVIATGRSNRLADFVELAFREVGLSWNDHVEIDAAFLRPTDLRRGFGDPSRAAAALGWKAKYHMPEVVKMMVAGERSLKASGRL
jgi:GDPmannose 4,6-dehydratase